MMVVDQPSKTLLLIHLAPASAALEILARAHGLHGYEVNLLELTALIFSAGPILNHPSSSHQWADGMTCGETTWSHERGDNI
jgi:hypothetical protein